MISQTTEYALRAAAALAAGNPAPRTGRALAAETHIPRGYLTKVLAPLVRARLVKASRGAGGGYRLARPPATTPLIEIMHAIEPPTPQTATPPRCALHQRIDLATAAFEQAFRDCSLADLAAQPPSDCARCRAGTPPR